MPRYTFVVTQTTYPCSRRLSYTGVRSAFSPEERLSQLLDTIQSVKKACPEASIIVLENGLRDISDLVPRDVPFVYYGSNPLVRWAADSKFKGLGEAVLLAAFLCSEARKNDADIFFKISGRYTITEGFSVSDFSLNKFSFLFYDKSVSTRLYSVPKAKLNKWLFSLVRCVPRLMRGHSIEGILPVFLRSSEVKSLKKLCVEGKIGVDTTVITE